MLTTDNVRKALRAVKDPELGLNIIDLGLVYDVEVSEPGDVHVKMTLTSPNCPVAGSLPVEVREKIKAIPNVSEAKVDVVWEPMWDPSKMSEAARLQLGIF